MNFLKGKKTYALAVCGIAYAITGFFSGHLDSKTAFDIIFVSLGLMGLRNGVTTEIQALTNFFPNTQEPLPPQPPQQ
jgi:hypothetical protein